MSIPTITVKIPTNVARDLIRFIDDPNPGTVPDPDWDALREPISEALRAEDYDPDEDPYSVGRLASGPSLEQISEWKRLKD